MAAQNQPNYFDPNAMQAILGFHPAAPAVLDANYYTALSPTVEQVVVAHGFRNCLIVVPEGTFIVHYRLVNRDAVVRVICYDRQCQVASVVTFAVPDC